MDNINSKMEQENVVLLRLCLMILQSTNDVFFPQHGLTLVVRSELPLGAGLGSSASLSACLSVVLLIYFHRLTIDNVINSETFALELINTFAFKCEQIFHGSPSGIECGNTDKYSEFLLGNLTSNRFSVLFSA